MSRTSDECTITNYVGNDFDVILPETLDGKRVVGIGDNAFANNEYVGTLTIPDSVISIGKNIVNIGYPSYTRLIVSDEHPTLRVTDDFWIDQSTHTLLAYFGGADETTAYVPAGVEIIGANAFLNSAATEVVIPDSVVDIEEGAFAGSSIRKALIAKYHPTLTYHDGFLVDTKEQRLIAYWGDSSKVVIPDGIIEICDRAFANNGFIESVILPQSVRIIGEFAFGRCENLCEIILPDELMKIGEEAFYSCKALKDIRIPDSVQEIGNSAFEDCSILTSIHIPDDLTEIGTALFCGCVSLSDVDVSSDHAVVSYKDGFVIDKNNHRLLAYCGQEEIVTIPKGIEEIGDGAFAEISSYSAEEQKLTFTRIKRVILPDSIMRIGNSSFANCERLREVDWSSNLKQIGDMAFFCCGALSDFVMPESLQKIGKYAFYKCTSLHSLDTLILPQALRVIGDNAFMECKNLSEIILPEGLEAIGDSAFAGCDKVTHVTIPNGATTIGRYAFDECDNLISVSVPKTVTSIGEYAFGISDRVETIYGEAGSEAETYAKGKRIEFLPLDAFKVMPTPRPVKKDTDDYVILVQTDGTCQIAKYKGEGEEVEIPNEIDGYRVIGIADGERYASYSGFSGLEDLKRVVIPEGIEYIGNDAFSGCSALESVSIPESVTRIGQFAFSSCDSLSRVVLSLIHISEPTRPY